MPSGGARANAGRRRKFGESSKKFRVPGSWTNEDVMEAAKARETVYKMREVVKSHKFESDTALLQQLKTMLFQEEK